MRPCSYRSHPGGGTECVWNDRLVLLAQYQVAERGLQRRQQTTPNLVFAQCMREKGFDVPDTGLTPDQLNDTSDAFNNALNECMMKVSNLTGEGNIANDPAVREAMVKGS